MTTPRARLLAILKEPDHYSSSSLLMAGAITDKNARHRLKRLCEEIAASIRSGIKNPYDLACAEEACLKGEIYFGGHYLPYDSERENIAAAIIALGEPNETEAK